MNARLFTDMATTFEAISRDPAALEAVAVATVKVGAGLVTTASSFLQDDNVASDPIASAMEPLKTFLKSVFEFIIKYGF